MKNTPIERSRVCFFLLLTALAHDRLLSSLFFMGQGGVFRQKQDVPSRKGSLAGRHLLTIKHNFHAKPVFYSKRKIML